MNEIEQLQEKLAYQEITTEKLNEAIASQQLQISQLQEQLKLLSQSMRHMRDVNQHGNNGQDIIEHEVPPHY